MKDEQKAKEATKHLTYLRAETEHDLSDDLDPVWNEDTGSTTENKPILCQNCPEQVMDKVIGGFYECPICGFVVL